MKLILLVLLWLAVSPVDVRPRSGTAGVTGAAVQSPAAVVAAEKGQAWSISEYRVVRTSEPGRDTTDVELVGAGGKVIGRFRQVQEVRAVPGSSADRSGEPWRIDHVDLDWQGRQLAIVTDRSAGTFEVTHNGVLLGTATFRRDRQEVPPAIAAVLKSDADLWRLAEAIGQDVIERR